jgi:hypothetical protein
MFLLMISTNMKLVATFNTLAECEDAMYWWQRIPNLACYVAI